MTNIFSSKQTVAELKADNETLQKSIKELTERLAEVKDQSQEIAGLQSALVKSKTDFEAVIKSMQDDFSKEVNALKEQISNLNQEKAQVVEQSKAEVEKAKEISQEQVKEKVMEGVALKIASMAIKEEDLPKQLPSAQAKHDQTRVIVHRNNISSDNLNN